MISGYEAFGLYQALKLHFTTDSYDYFKYGGKTNISVTAFENRKDKYHFYKLSRKYTNKEDLINFIVANFIEDERSWVGPLLQEEADMNFRKRQKVIQSLSYTFENDCILIFEDCILNPYEVLKTDGDYPVLLTKTLRKEIQVESLCLLNHFLPQDSVKYKLILKKVLNENL